jgi:hypothetical protein
VSSCLAYTAGLGQRFTSLRAALPCPDMTSIR